MDYVISDAVPEREKRHFSSKIRKILKQFMFAYLFRGTGANGNDANAVAGVLDFGNIGVRAAGKDIDGKTKTGNVAAELSYVDVHPASVFAAEVGERRGMDRNSRDTIQDVSF